jgi:Uma2 family endonuclease
MSALLSIPRIKNQTVFNIDRWEEIGRNSMLRNWPGRVETDRYGNPIMMCYAEFSHGGKQFDIASLLQKHVPAGKVTVECPISTSEGIKLADVVWMSKKRLVQVGGRVALKGAPEICVEVISPGNKRGEIEEKRRLYFEAGATEVWGCDRRGRLSFFLKEAPETAAASLLCPKVPRSVSVD